MSDRKIDLESIALGVMEKYGFDPEFPGAVIRETERLREEPESGAFSDIRDLRSLLWSSIDNSDSEDLDQVEYCVARRNGEIEVLVAIADVDFFVRQGSGTDRHAAFNGTSVYLGVRTFPMLPDRLSKGLSSLLPGKDRRAVVLSYTVLPDGSVKHGEVFYAVVRNQQKLVYEEVGAWLEGTAPVPPGISAIPGLGEQVRLQAEVCRRLRDHRMQQGALDLQTIEAQPVMVGGAIRGLVVQEQNIARQIIEELMVAANQTMVHALGSARVPMIQRVVRRPRNWDGIVATAGRYRFHLPRQPDSRALARFLDRQRRADPGRFPDLSLTVVKLMGPGEYVSFVPGDIPIGHFALAVLDYTHSTAPNRRFTDLVNQRILKAVLDRRPLPYTDHELDRLAVHLTGRDRAAEKAARFMRKVAAAILLHDRTGETFPAIVTGAAEKGTYVRLLDPPAEGRVIEGERGLAVGDRVTVRLIGTSPELGYVDFACVRREEVR